MTQISLPLRRMAGPPANPLTAAIENSSHGLAYAALFSCIINLLMLTGPLFMMQIYDRVLTSRSVPTLVALCGLVLGLYAIMGVLELVRTRVMIRIGGLIDADVRSLVFNRVVEQAVRRSPGGSQPLRDLETMRQFSSSQAPFALLDMPWIPIYIGVTYLIHPLLALLTVIGCAILFATAYLNEKSVKNGQSRGHRAQMEANQLFEQITSGAETLHALGMRKNYEEIWDANYDAAVSHQRSEADRASTFSSASKTIRLILQSAVLALGGYLVISGDMTGGAMIAASIISARAMAPVDQAIGNWRAFLGFRQAKDRLEKLLGAAAAEPERMPLPRPDGRLAVENLTIVPPGGGKPLLRGLNFKINPGEGLGVIGPTGSGKSTLARALVGVLAPAAGTIRLSGATLDQWPVEQLGRHIGYLPQEVRLFPGTVQQNIARFAPDADPQAVIRAAGRANVHDLILKLPEGYNTRLGPDGHRLSGGQTQRLGLARALFGDPVLLVLDEPNANLDAEGEAALLKSLSEARTAGASVIIVAHRPSAIRTVDNILYLKEGTQVIFGPKNEVLEKINEAAKSEQRAAAGHLSVVSEAK